MMATAKATQGTKSKVLDEIAQVRKNLPQINFQSATSHFLTAIYEKTPHRRIKLTLTFPEGYPDRNALIVDVAAEKGVPRGLKKKLEKELGAVAEQGKQGQVEAVLSRLVNFVDTNKFVPCWRELKQVVEMVQTSAQNINKKGSTVAIHDAKGLIKLRIQGSQYYYSCSVTIDDAYPTTTSNHDWGHACRLVVTATNLAPSIERLLTSQAHELIRRMQDGMAAQDALQMSNPIRALPSMYDQTSANKKGNPSAKERKGARREIVKITQTEISYDNMNDEEKEQHRQAEEQTRLVGYNISVHDGSQPQPSLQTLVTFLNENIQHLPEEMCPLCKELSLPDDPKILKSMYTNPVSSAPDAEKKARQLARKRRPIRTYCGCWYHHSCLNTVLTEPPFGASCPVDSHRRVYHPDWPDDMQELERAWAAKEAKQREIDDAALAFL